MGKAAIQRGKSRRPSKRAAMKMCRGATTAAAPRRIAAFLTEKLPIISVRRAVADFLLNFPRRCKATRGKCPKFLPLRPEESSLPIWRKNGCGKVEAEAKKRRQLRLLPSRRYQRILLSAPFPLPRRLSLPSKAGLRLQRVKAAFLMPFW